MRIGLRISPDVSVLEAWEDDDDAGYRPASTVGVPPGDLVVKVNSQKGEGAMHCLLDHPCIVKCYGPYANGIKQESLILEYCRGGDLEKQALRMSPDEARLKKWILQIVDALDYLHNTLYICHRDVKPSNVFLDDNDNAKLGDFGLAATAEKARTSSKYVGTPNYISPEVVQKHCTDYYASDVWSLGGLVYFMLTGVAPFQAPEYTRQGTYDRILRLDYAHPEALYAAGISDEARDLVTRGLLVLDPASRFTLDQIRAHKWFSPAAFGGSL